MSWLVKFKLGLILCFVSVSGLSATPIIWNLTDSRLAGEEDQINGVTYALVHKIQREQKVPPKVEILDLKEEKGGKGFNFAKLNLISKDNPEAIFISSGSYGIQAFQALKEARAQGVFVYVSHQIIGDDKQDSVRVLSLKGVADFIVLPHHVFEVSDPRADVLKAELEGSSTRLLEITGVVHNMHQEDLIEDIKKYRQEIPDAKKYMLVILGGDVQNKDGTTWNFYGPLDAKKLAQYVEAQMKQDPTLFVLVTNGPRTGRFDPKTKEDANFHQKGGPLDPVTQVFMESLSHKSHVRLYNFEKGGSSLFKALLGVTSETKGSVLVPGESTSMISQAIDTMPKGSVVLYNHGAMQDIHEQHVRDEFLKGRVFFLDTPQEGKEYSFTKSQIQEEVVAASLSGSDVVANQVWELLQERGQKLK